MNQMKIILTLSIFLGNVWAAACNDGKLSGTLTGITVETYKTTDANNLGTADVLELTEPSDVPILKAVTPLSYSFPIELKGQCDKWTTQSVKYIENTGTENFEIVEKEKVSNVRAGGKLYTEEATYVNYGDYNTSIQLLDNYSDTINGGHTEGEDGRYSLNGEMIFSKTENEVEYFLIHQYYQTDDGNFSTWSQFAHYDKATAIETLNNPAKAKTDIDTLYVQVISLKYSIEGSGSTVGNKIIDELNLNQRRLRIPEGAKNLWLIDTKGKIIETFEIDGTNFFEIPESIKGTIYLKIDSFKAMPMMLF